MSKITYTDKHGRTWEYNPFDGIWSYDRFEVVHDIYHDWFIYDTEAQNDTGSFESATDAMDAAGEDKQ